VPPSTHPLPLYQGGRQDELSLNILRKRGGGKGEGERGRERAEVGASGFVGAHLNRL